MGATHIAAMDVVPVAVSSRQDTQITDELADLLGLASAGCRSSFETLYRRTSGRLFAIILRVNGEQAEAEEVLQDIYLKIWHECKQFDPTQGQATYWLASIARNGAIDSLERRAARPKKDVARMVDDDDPYAEFQSSDAGPLEALILRRRLAAVQTSLRTLCPEVRESLTLAFYGGLSYEEVAGKLCRPVGTVKSWVRRSLRGLRASLDADL